MALSEDQKAMLRLLAQRGEQGYEDLSALLGIGPEEVYAKAQAAAGQLEAEGIPAPEIPPPPKGGAPVPMPAEPAERAPAEKERAAPASPPKAPSSPRSRLKLPESRGARFAIAANALAVLAIVVIVLASLGGDDDGSDSPGETTASGETAAAAAADTPNLTQAVLEPVGGGDAEGRAIFGRIKKNVILQVQAEGLEPSPQGSSYTVWLYKSPKLALRIGSVEVSESGGIAAQFPLPTEVLALVAGGAFDQIDISLTGTAEYAAEVAKAKKQERLPSYTGEDVLRGPITGPALEAARKAGRE
jgi:hypothetical protein